jgi:hypothetical protein
VEAICPVVKDEYQSKEVTDITRLNELNIANLKKIRETNRRFLRKIMNSEHCSELFKNLAYILLYRKMVIYHYTDAEKARGKMFTPRKSVPHEKKE